MSSIHSTVLIIGATSGIGAGLARSIHAQGKVVIATGRRQDRFDALKAELPSLQTSCFDISDIASLRSKISGLTNKYPELDTVILCAGVQSYFSIEDPSSTSAAAIEKEITINTTAPIVLCHLLVPFLLSPQRPASIIIVGSGLAFVPLPFLPLYGPTKSAIHSFSVALRADLAGTKVRVTELSPPYVDTELDKALKEEMVDKLGGPAKASTPMLLEEHVQKTMEGLERGKEETGVGFGELALQTWRTAFGPFLEKFHLEG
jgi:short-subunit dehydrogenase involved in D-alanine esterification of teichoic acids